MKGKIKKGLAITLASAALLPLMTGCTTKNEEGYYMYQYKCDTNIAINENNQRIMHKGDVYLLEDFVDRGAAFAGYELHLDCGQELLTTDFIIYTESSHNNPQYKKCERCFGE